MDRQTHSHTNNQVYISKWDAVKIKENKFERTWSTSNGKINLQTYFVMQKCLQIAYFLYDDLVRFSNSICYTNSWSNNKITYQ